MLWRSSFTSVVKGSWGTGKFHPLGPLSPILGLALLPNDWPCWPTTPGSLPELSLWTHSSGRHEAVTTFHTLLHQLALWLSSRKRAFVDSCQFQLIHLCQGSERLFSDPFWTLTSPTRPTIVLIPTINFSFYNTRSGSASLIAAWLIQTDKASYTHTWSHYHS